MSDKRPGRERKDGRVCEIFCGQIFKRASVCEKLCVARALMPNPATVSIGQTRRLVGYAEFCCRRLHLGKLSRLVTANGRSNDYLSTTGMILEALSTCSRLVVGLQYWSPEICFENHLIETA